jgi:hypothetical protein
MSGSESLFKAVLAFAGHVAAGSAIFVILAMAAFGLGKFVHLLEVWGADHTLVTMLGGLEYVIFGADALSMLFFLYSALRAAYREIKSERYNIL